MTKEELKEIRDALLGRTVLADDGRITTLEPGFHLSAGVSDGAGAVRFFGVSRKRFAYSTSSGEYKTMEAARTAMANIGRGLLLRLQPDTAACLIRSLLTRPVVLTFRYESGVPVLTAFTGRSPSGWLAVRRAVYAFTDELPDGIERSAETPPEDGDQIKTPRKARKAAKGAKKDPAEDAAAVPADDTPDTATEQEVPEQ